LPHKTEQHVARVLKTPTVILKQHEHNFRIVHFTFFSFTEVVLMKKLMKLFLEKLTVGHATLLASRQGKGTSGINGNKYFPRLIFCSSFWECIFLFITVVRYIRDMIICIHLFAKVFTSILAILPICCNIASVFRI
jgi:hypothetical protein